MLVMFEGIVTEASPLQPEKVENQIIFTPSGIVTLVNPLQSEKAEPSMFVTLDGIEKSPSFC